MKPVAPVTSTVCRAGSFSTSPAAGAQVMRARRFDAKKSRRPHRAAPAAAAAAIRLSHPV